MSRMRTKDEIAEIRQKVMAEQAALFPDDEIRVAVSKSCPPRNGVPDWSINRSPKRWSDD